MTNTNRLSSHTVAREQDLQMFTIFYNNLQQTWITISLRDKSYSTAKIHRSLCSCMTSYHGKILQSRDDVSLYQGRGEIIVCPIRPP